MVELTTDSTSLAEMLAYIKRKVRSGCLLIREEQAGGEVEARLYFDEGHLVDVRRGVDSGDDIIYRLLGSKMRQRFSWQNGSPAPGTSISRADEYFLLATLGLQDDVETMRRQSDIEQVLDAPEPLSPPPAEQLAAQPDRVAQAQLRFTRHDTMPLPLGRAVALDDVLALASNVGVTPEDDSLAHLLDGLAVQLFSGYLSWERRGSRGVLLLYRGQIIDALWRDSGVLAGGFATLSADTAAAYRQIEREASQNALRSAATLTALDDDFVRSYAALAYGENALGSRPSREQSLTSLLTSLSRNAHTGCLKVTVERDEANEGESAYIFMAEGVELGRYRESLNNLETDSTYPFALARNTHALLDVYTSPSLEQLAILTVPADSSDPALQLAQRDQRLRQPTRPATSPAPQERRAAPITQKIDTGEIQREEGNRVSQRSKPPPPTERAPSPPATSRPSPQSLSRELQQVARTVLGNKASSVITILAGVAQKPSEMDKTISRAKLATKMLIGVDEYEELSNRFDALLATYRRSQREG